MKRLYGILWRWHFLAGLAACPVLFVVAITGAAYAFAPELQVALDRDLYTVEPIEGAPRGLDATVAAAGCDAQWLTVYGDRTRAAEVFCADGRAVHVDPYRAKVLGDRRGRDLFGTALAIHWELLLGDTGRLVIEWASSVAVLLFLSGAYLWWPRDRVAAHFWPRRGTTGRTRLRDLHAVFGAYAMPILLAIAATGLLWTRLAGDQRWRPLLDDAPPPPVSAPHGDRPRIGLDAAAAAAQLTGTRLDLGVPPPSTPDEAYAFRVTAPAHGSPSASRLIFVDAYTGARLGERTWGDLSLARKLDAAAYSLHTGAILGWPGRIAVFLAALVLSGLCITGPWMWWRRRPRGQLGAPPRPRRASAPLFVLLAGLGWLLPALGWTLLAALVVEIGVRVALHVSGKKTAAP